MNKDLNLMNNKTGEKKHISMVLLNIKDNYFNIVAIEKSEFESFAIKLYNLEDKLRYDEIDFDNNEYQNLLNKIEDKSLGICQFFLEKNGFCYLNLIKVDPKNRNLGIGSNLLKLMESYARKHGAYFVEGKFIPDKDSSKFLENFYKKNGYKIECDCYMKMVGKSINCNKEENSLSF
ncbi:MAG: GNAT family N-acetyltransferase [Christensenellales bacterium]